MNIRHNNEINQDMEAGSEQFAGEIQGDSLLTIIWRNHWLVLLSVIVCVAGAIIYISKATPIYSSTARIYVEQRGPKIMTEMEGVMTQSKNYLYTQASLLTRPQILEKVVSDSEITRYDTFLNIDNRVAYLRKAIRVDVGKKDDIISVTFESPYPEEAAVIVNKVVEEYQNDFSDTQKGTASKVLEILTTEKTKRDKELNDSYQAVLNFKVDNKELSLEDGRGNNVLIENLNRLMTAHTEATIVTIKAKGLHEAAKTMSNDPEKLKQLIESQRSNVYISMNQEETQLQTEKNQLEMHRTDLLRKINPTHPGIKTIDTKLVQVQTKLEKIEDERGLAYLEVLHQNWQAAIQQEKEFATQVHAQRDLAQELNTKAAELAIIESELKRTENLCDILDSRIKELKVTEDTGALNIKPLEFARAGENPIKPQRSRLLAMAMVLGMMLGVGGALVRDWMDHCLRSSEEVAAVLGVPVLGVIPSMKKGKKTVVQRGNIVVQEPMSQTAEAYKTVRTAVYFGVPEGNAKTIVVTSPAPGEGKSTLVSNLAATMAQAGQKTIVLDCDFRKPTQHAIFDADQEPGLSSVLAGQEKLENVIRPTTQDKLSFISCGPIPVNPSELLSSDAFAETIRQLSEKYDRIVIDSPPVMAVTDSRILAAMCDVTILVVRANKSTQKASQQAREGLVSVGAHLLGAIVNDVKPGKGKYGYYSGYGYGYGYGYGHKINGSGAAKV
ncbi:MAG: polysaccharide biosynthesis tyrosine autokinase [Phycisphaerae bacterium]|nr:polysaccharide biosynthesis tyrosine autokinase [Phycisphaerae bacterium]